MGEQSSPVRSSKAPDPQPIADISSALKIAQRPAETIVAACAALGFVQFRDGKFSLTPLSEDYLLPTSPN